ncbi:acyltransferase family protein [Burkholderia sp. HI2500]|uniref:acyltransferase family protein n=1 Tax=Burkholderia sp. HI2500 TaxID=2015358 RepID=UPI000B79ED59|nr:acyltransferase [Burkholderia sp. HI2500]OXJ09681.1 acyltransferase [Burkholderia sp. HI2500]
MDFVTPSFDTLLSPTPDKLYFPACLAAVAIIAWFVARHTPFYRFAVDQSLSMRYRNLDGFRGILATSVVFHHFACNQGLLTTGSWGTSPGFLRNLGTIPVAMFFMVTGFLFWERACKGTLDVRTFFVGRVRRVAPLYLACAIVIVVCTLVWFPRHVVDAPTQLLADVLKTVSLGWFGAFPINGARHTSYLSGVWWTLGYEWRFYAVVPFLAWFVATHAWRKLFALAIVTICATLFGQPGSLALLFALGAVAFEMSRHPAIRARLDTKSAATVALLILAVAPSPGERYSIEGVLPLLPVFVCVACGNTFYGVLKTRPLALLGTVSFSIYMIHMVIVYVLIHAINRFVFQIGSADDLQRWMLSLGCALVAVLCALLTYRYIEHPFIAKRSSARPAHRSVPPERERQTATP